MARAEETLAFGADFLATHAPLAAEEDAFMANFTRSPLPALQQVPFPDSWPGASQADPLYGGPDLFLHAALQPAPAETAWPTHDAFSADPEPGSKRRKVAYQDGDGLQRLIFPALECEPDSGESSADACVLPHTPRIPTSPAQQVVQTPVRRNSSAGALMVTSAFSVVKGDPCDPRNARQPSLADVNRRLALCHEADTPTCSQGSQASRSSAAKRRPSIKVNGMLAPGQPPEAAPSQHSACW